MIYYYSSSSAVSCCYCAANPVVKHTAQVKSDKFASLRPLTAQYAKSMHAHRDGECSM